ncbi:MAG TPA: hypothetical protein VJM12_12710 [Pyrinomonadaceae bacterium]|nr:hypothetical protein [Pyrinomonadaceae bacterium]
MLESRFVIIGDFLILIGAPEDLRHESNVHPILYVDPLHGGCNVDGLPDGGHVLICSPLGRAAGEGAPIETDH